MYQIFWDEPRLGGGQALVQKRGQVPDGGIDKIFARWGDSPVPPGKKTWVLAYMHSYSWYYSTVHKLWEVGTLSYNGPERLMLDVGTICIANFHTGR